MGLFDRLQEEFDSTPDKAPETPKAKRKRPKGFLNPHVTPPRGLTTFGHHPEDVRGALGTKYSKCSEVVGYVPRASTVDLVTMGVWQSIDVVCHLALQIGRPVDFVGSTWSISRKSANLITAGVIDGTFRRVRILTDFRQKTNNVEAADQLQSVLKPEDYRITTNHSKVYLISDEGEGIEDPWYFTVLGSSNLTSNSRCESQVIREGEEVYRFHRKWIEEVMDNSAFFGEEVKMEGEA